eukprot:TRINITY_DN19439_c0_g1_i1.p2 TRINITY_DN19439_c0_g1~~TRINITY_DN19439_c0_g1_i1.p2  ORF type:complete len:128 (+),score=1.43 TRINITY_DN19439_c0_g1_i1:132-515(+)
MIMGGLLEKKMYTIVSGDKIVKQFREQLQIRGITRLVFYITNVQLQVPLNMNILQSFFSLLNFPTIFFRKDLIVNQDKFYSIENCEVQYTNRTQCIWVVIGKNNLKFLTILNFLFLMQGNSPPSQKP